jgi:hypothetical protein
MSVHLQSAPRTPLPPHQQELRLPSSLSFWCEAGMHNSKEEASYEVLNRVCGTPQSAPINDIQSGHNQRATAHQI